MLHQRQLNFVCLYFLSFLRIIFQNQSMTISSLKIYDHAQVTIEYIQKKINMLDTLDGAALIVLLSFTLAK